MAQGIVYDWQRRNEDLKRQLREVQKDLKGDQTMTMYLEDGASFAFPEIANLKGQENPREQLEIENKLLMDIVAQVRADLQKANMTSPNSTESKK